MNKEDNEVYFLGKNNPNSIVSVYIYIHSYY